MAFRTLAHTQMQRPPSTFACFVGKCKPSPEQRLAYSHWTIKKSFFLQLDGAMNARWHAPRALPPPEQPGNPLFDILTICLNTLDDLCTSHHQSSQQDEELLGPEYDHIRRTKFGMRTTISVVNNFWTDETFSGLGLYDFFTWVQRNMYVNENQSHPRSPSDCWAAWLSQSGVRISCSSDMARQQREWKQEGDRDTLECMTEAEGLEGIMPASVRRYWWSLVWVLSEVDPLNQ
ncbi:hypothetical protein AC578_7037 [Pseudocercospora eumusae]|uniref:Uncharacterized protein n=1 Tax=Pseudocercospora eumusae TaxID=321146 RepID=A0A139GVU1_9PEZI|nr:hypothetical protein AC578_7037 [Pseudocercospora eumusae]